MGWRFAIPFPVIGDIPPAALELQSGRGEQAMYVTAARLMNLERLIGEFLHHLKDGSASFALILVKWHPISQPHNHTTAGSRVSEY